MVILHARSTFGYFTRSLHDALPILSPDKSASVYRLCPPRTGNSEVESNQTFQGVRLRERRGSPHGVNPQTETGFSTFTNRAPLDRFVPITPELSPFRRAQCRLPQSRRAGSIALR